MSAQRTEGVCCGVLTKSLAASRFEHGPYPLRQFASRPATSPYGED
jgi:hypothetical protein